MRCLRNNLILQIRKKIRSDIFSFFAWLWEPHSSTSCLRILAKINTYEKKWYCLSFSQRLMILILYKLRQRVISGLVRFFLHINHCRLFNTNTYQQICLQILYIWYITFLNEPELIFWHTVIWFPVVLCFTNNSIKHKSFVYTRLNDQTVLFLTTQFSISQQKLNGSKYCYVLLIIQLNISHLLALSLNCQTVLFDSYIGPYPCQGRPGRYRNAEIQNI